MQKMGLDQEKMFHSRIRLREIVFLIFRHFYPLQSLTQPKAYIVTQGPTETSIGDFWRMVWQERASCIVMVTRSDFSDDFGFT